MSNSAHWAQMGEWSFIWGMRFLLGVYLRFGRRVLQWFLYPVVSYYWLLNRPARQASQDYLARLNSVAPALNPGGSYLHFISFANAIIDKLAAWSGALSLDDVDYVGRDALLAELANGRGVLLLGSHLGNLEVCQVIAELDQAVVVNVLVHTKHAEKFNRLLNNANGNRRLKLWQVTELNAATAMLLSDYIDAGELVIIAADRTPVANRQRVVKAEFLGAPALFPEGPFILAGLLKCPVYTVFCLKQKERHIIYFELFCECLQLPRAARAEVMQTSVQRYAQRLQGYCLKAPLQWFNFYDFWRIPDDGKP